MGYLDENGLKQVLKGVDEKINENCNSIRDDLHGYLSELQDLEYRAENIENSVQQQEEKLITVEESVKNMGYMDEVDARRSGVNDISAPYVVLYIAPNVISRISAKPSWYFHYYFLKFLGTDKVEEPLPLKQYNYAIKVLGEEFNNIEWPDEFQLPRDVELPDFESGVWYIINIKRGRIVSWEKEKLSQDQICSLEYTFNVPEGGSIKSDQLLTNLDSNKIVNIYVNEKPSANSIFEYTTDTDYKVRIEYLNYEGITLKNICPGPEAYNSSIGSFMTKLDLSNISPNTIIDGPYDIGCRYKFTITPPKNFAFNYNSEFNWEPRNYTLELDMTYLKMSKISVLNAGAIRLINPPHSISGGTFSFAGSNLDKEDLLKMGWDFHKQNWHMGNDCFMSTNLSSAGSINEGWVITGDYTFVNCYYLKFAHVEVRDGCLGMESFRNCPAFKEIILSTASYSNSTYSFSKNSQMQWNSKLDKVVFDGRLISFNLGLLDPEYPTKIYFNNRYFDSSNVSVQEFSKYWEVTFYDDLEEIDFQYAPTDEY